MPNIAVYFDNLQVNHIHSPLLEEMERSVIRRYKMKNKNEHRQTQLAPCPTKWVWGYYPFGLTMASTSATVIHELLDHGLQFIRGGYSAASATKGTEVSNVTYQNIALKIINSPLRTEHSHN